MRYYIPIAMQELISPFQKDALVEVVNIGASKAATMLSQLIDGNRVVIQPPDVIVDVGEKIPAFIGDEKNVHTAVLLALSGSAPGVLLFTFPPTSAIQMAALLSAGDRKESPILDESDRTILRNMGNTLADATIDSLSNFLTLQITKSSADIATDMLGSILDAIVVDMSARSFVVLAFRVRFTVEVSGAEPVSGQMCFMFEPKATDTILTSLRNKFPNSSV